MAEGEDGRGWAPAKAILFGEHAVVYGRPALAIPVHGMSLEVRRQAPGDPGLQEVTAEAWRLLGQEGEPPGVRAASSIPVGAGLGSSAALCVGLLRALSPEPLDPRELARLAHRLEHRFHGTPSGIDTTVVALGRPVWFRRGRPVEELAVGRPLRFLLLDSGERASTAEVVAEVRRRHQEDRANLEALFDALGWIAHSGRRALQEGDEAELGRLMLACHRQLQDLGVSSAGLDRLVERALAAGARGAKLSGAGRGGHVLALVPEGLEIEGGRETRLAGRRAGA